MISSIGSTSTKGLTTSFNKALQDKDKANERLSSGKRVNRASDDPAALAIIASLEAEVRSGAQAVRNTSDAVSAADIADGALGTITDAVTRIEELAAQSANGTLSDEQRTALSTEANALRDEVSRIVSTTTFNGQSLFNQTLTAQVGTDGSSNSQISFGDVNVAQSISSLSSVDIGTAEGARAALDVVSTARSSITTLRGEIGAAVSRLETAQSNQRSSIEANERAAASLRDADVAEESARKVAADIRSKAGLAVQAQANLSSQNVLKLLS